MTNETTLTVHGEAELAARAARLFGETKREFFCAANDLSTWARAEVAGGPEVEGPMTGEPGSGGPGPGRPAAGGPGSGGPAMGGPGRGGPGSGEPVAGLRVADGSEAGVPAAGRHTADEPEPGEPAAGRPVAGESAPGLSEARGAVVRRLRGRIAGGVVVRKLYTPAVLSEEDQRLHLFNIAYAGGQVRLRAATLPHEVIIIDRRVMIVAGRRGPRGREFTITTVPALVEGTHALMRATWDAGVPFADYLRRETDGLDADSIPVLRALAAGLTDAVGARRVGMSVRTYRRRVAELMSALEADSRFQAGVHASRLGLTGS